MKTSEIAVNTVTQRNTTAGGQPFRGGRSSQNCLIRRGTAVAHPVRVRTLFLGWLVFALVLFGLGHLTHERAAFLAASHHAAQK
jgi:hypothetical protein